MSFPSSSGEKLMVNRVIQANRSESTAVSLNITQIRMNKNPVMLACLWIALDDGNGKQNNMIQLVCSLNFTSI